MSQLVEWAEGETAPRDFPLTDAGVPFDLAGAALSLILHDAGEVAVSNPGTVAIQGTSANGIARFTPTDSSVLQAKKSPYRARFKAVKAGQDYYFPNDKPGDRWEVGKQ